MNIITTNSSFPGSTKESNVCRSIFDSPNPFLFIVGSPRSGTTLLKRMVRKHPEIAVTRETHWIPGYFKHHTGLTEDGYATKNLVLALLEYKRFPDLGLNPEDVSRLVSGDEQIHYRDFVTLVFDLYGKRKHKRLVADKTPSYVREIAVLHELWPKARFIHLIRDGRDVCLSMRNWRMVHRTAGQHSTWTEDPVSTAALWWEWQIRLGREAGAELPAGLYYEMRYEDMVADPEGQLRAMCEFLGVSFADRMLRYHEGHTSNEAGLSANEAWLPPTQGLRDWRTQMSHDDLERFETSAGELLNELGLERAIPNPSAEALAHAARMRSMFDGKPLPKNW